MPSWSIHCAIAKKIKEHLDVDENLFLCGNSVADVDDNINNYGSYATHFYGTLMCDVCEGEELPDINRFYTRYKNKLSNPLILGYYCHLLTDYYFNYYTYKDHWLLDENGKVIGLKLKDGEEFITHSNYLRQDIKRKDFAKYGRYLYDLGMVKFPLYDDSILEYCKELTPLFINKQDIDLMIKYCYDLYPNCFFNDLSASKASSGDMLFISMALSFSFISSSNGSSN